MNSRARWAASAAMVLVMGIAGCNGVGDADDVTWETRAPVPEARTEGSATTDGNLVYLVGGFQPGTGAGPAPAPRALLAYDPAADGWTAVDTIPEGVNHAGFAALNGRLYVVGGYRDTTFQPTGTVRVYDLASGTWSTAAPLRTPRGALAVVALDGRLHAIGGNVSDTTGLLAEDHGIIGQDGSVATHEVYDPGTNTWSRARPMITSRNHLGAAVANGRIYVVGGRLNGDFELRSHEVYDPGTGEWSAIEALPTGRSGIAVVSHRNMVYVFGGETFGPSPAKTFDEAERYDPATGRWERLPPMPTARHGLGAAPIGDAIYVVSGGADPGFAFSTANERLVVR
jgi:N-acetylneuraminic acid mutarotase